jgi:phosphate transport system protein
MMRINHELERDADLMVNVAKTTRRIYPHELDPKIRGIIDRMGIQASNQTRLAGDAFADPDPSWAAALGDMDDTMDELTKSLFRHILAWGASDEATVLQAVQVALVGRHYERTPTTRSDRRAGPVHGHRHAPRRDRRGRPGTSALSLR